ncbi:hypothetical protein H8B02_18100 [Bradyrhizobium sp. Pear77]|uniref:hypothetical protein n=1 Tax=Bradyrhizobium altum TaxID=1571202 RepID=UPI001E6004A0|nr:hypothetical protein [Bradyrhizobium altum]MCC8955280.1 hypothetical protein [Bradyrhizobium altum]
MTAPSRKRQTAGCDDRPLHGFGDVGPAIAAADWKPRVCGNPEKRLAAAFVAMGRDYGGPVFADILMHVVFTELQAALTAPAAHSGIEQSAEAE